MNLKSEEGFNVQPVASDQAAMDRRAGIVFAEDVEAGPRRGRMARKDSTDSMSIRPRSRSVDPSLALPPQFRTL